MSFDFVMDAFPAYTKFDKTHKCLCALQVIGGDQGEAANDTVICDPVEPAADTYPITEVVVGPNSDIWKLDLVVIPESSEGADDAVTIQQMFSPEPTTQEELDAALAQLGRNLGATINGLDIDFSGTVIHASNFVEASGFDSAGYYLPIAVKTVNGLFEVDTEGQSAEKADSIESGVYQVIIYNIDQNAPVQTIKATSTTGSGEQEQTDSFYYAFDFSNINFA